ncbi:MAG TPA: thiamine pyrophosphate-binding protein [Candidatus Lokiarchaeia archaeon]|nr:thiamine pyrophosphate-binding protein [Candidatus Lokiarchaeia archaeon]
MDQDLDAKAIVKNGLGIARLLANRGVKHVFGIPDGHTLEFYDGLLQTEGIQHVLVNDERTAAFAADAYARVSGTLGVCDAGAAGALNFPVALAEAKGASSPVLAIVGMVRAQSVLLNIPHDVSITDTLKPVTKWCGMAFHTDHVPRFLNYAIRQAINGRPGPAAVVIPEDLFSSTGNQLGDFLLDTKGGACSINGCRSGPAEYEVERAVEMIRAAVQPAILAGGGAISSAAYPEVEKLARLIQAPVFSTITGKGIMVPRDDEDNLYFGTIGLFGETPNNKYIRKNADLVIVVGSRLTEDDTAYFKYPPDRKAMIQIDIDPSEIGKQYHPWGVAGDAKVALEMILKDIEAKGFAEGANPTILDDRKASIEALREEHASFREKDNAKWMDADPIKPQRVLKAIADALDKNDYLVTDASASSRWIGPYFPVKSLGRKIITPRGVGPTGFGVGALIGTCIASDTWDFTGRKAKKVLFTGDGGLMNGGVTDFETIMKLGLDCTIVVINNAALGFVKFGQGGFGHYYETERPATDFARIAEGFGGQGTRVDSLAGLDTAIGDAIRSEGFQLVDVVVDPKELLPPSFY